MDKIIEWGRLTRPKKIGSVEITIYIKLCNNDEKQHLYDTYCKLCGVYIPPYMCLSGPMVGFANEAVLECFKINGYRLIFTDSYG